MEYRNSNGCRSAGLAPTCLLAWATSVASRARRVGLCAIGCAALFAADAANAADHEDSPSTTVDPQSDINDVYTFMNPNDAEELIVAMTVFPDAQTTDTFSTDISYDFLIESQAGTSSTPVENLRISCTFPSVTEASCALSDRVVTAPVGQTGSTDGMRLYTGLRDDPFYFNLSGFEESIAIGMPRFAETTEANDGRVNDFAGHNVLVILLGIDRNIVTANQSAPILKIWASTEAR